MACTAVMRWNHVPPRRGAELLAELRALIDALPQAKRRAAIDSLRKFFSGLSEPAREERK